MIEKAGVEVAQRFRRSATETFQDLARMPESGSPSKVRRPEFVQVRMHRVKGFENYLIFYFPRDFGVTIERVLHAKRDYQRVLR